MNSTTAVADTLYGAGHWLIEQQRHEDAKHVFRTMLSLAPSDERGWLALGACHEQANELETAARLYRLAPLACGTALRCVIANARVLRKLARDDLAEEAYAAAAELADDADDAELAAIIAAEVRT
jgi:tetratricopeptide (TPR) repeat protein